jgi:hypothetical protein
VDDPTFNQRGEIAQAALDATTVVYVPLAAAVGVSFFNCALTMMLDGENFTRMFRVRRVCKIVKAGGLSHLMLYCRET